MSLTEGLSYVLCWVCWSQLELPGIICVQHNLTLGLFSQRPVLPGHLHQIFSTSCLCETELSLNYIFIIYSLQTHVSTKKVLHLQIKATSSQTQQRWTVHTHTMKVQLLPFLHIATTKLLHCLKKSSLFQEGGSSAHVMAPWEDKCFHHKHAFFLLVYPSFYCKVEEGDNRVGYLPHSQLCPSPAPHPPCSLKGQVGSREGVLLSENCPEISRTALCHQHYFSQKCKAGHCISC